METKETIGWILLALGIIIILVALLYSYQIFIGKSEAPKIINLENEVIQETPQNTGDASAQAERIIREQINKIFSPETMSAILNLIIFSFFVFILIGGGGKISTIGVKLLSTEDKEKK